MPFFRFVLAGGTAAVVNWVSGLLLVRLLPLEASVVIAYLIAMTAAFVLNRRFVFPLSGRSMQAEYLRFAAVNGVALIQVWIVTIGLARWIFPSIGFDFHPAAVAHAVGIVTPVGTSYFLHRHFTFARKA